VKGLKLSEAVQKFLDNPENPEWNLDENPWPSNQGCSGIRRNIMREK
jgi:hypothetical protein